MFGTEMPVTAKLDGALPFPDHPSAKDFDLLRDADADLEKQVSKLSFTRLLLVIILTFMFGSALHRRNEVAIQGTLDEISGSNNVHIRKLDPISTYLLPSIWYPSDWDLQAHLSKLKGQYKEVFTVKFSVLGTDLSFDLRLIIVSFPLWLPLAQIYVSILREKRRLLRFIGHTLLKRCAPDQLTAVDLLLFGAREGAYRAYPSVLLNVSFWSVVVVLLTMMLWITDTRATEAAPPLIRVAVVVMLISAFYASAFSSLISTRLRQQVETQLGTSVPVDTFGRVWRWLNRLAVSLPALMKPRLPLATSSILILLTMVLQTGQVGCNRAGTAGASRPGYELLVGSADWPPSLDPLFHDVSASQNFLGRALYALSLLLALVGLILVSLITIGKLPPSALLLILGRVCAAISIVFISQFSNPVLFLWKGWPSFLPLALTIALLILARLTGRQSPQWGGRIHRGLRMGYVPLLLADLVYVAAIARSLPGLVILFCSIPFMTLGYLSAYRMAMGEGEDARAELEQARA